MGMVTLEMAVTPVAWLNSAGTVGLRLTVSLRSATRFVGMERTFQQGRLVMTTTLCLEMGVQMIAKQKRRVGTVSTLRGSQVPVTLCVEMASWYQVKRHAMMATSSHTMGAQTLVCLNSCGAARTTSC